MRSFHTLFHRASKNSNSEAWRSTHVLGVYKKGLPMQPKLVTVAPFTVSGLCARTILCDEAEPSKAKLPGLWDQFFSKNLMEVLPGMLADSPVYGVYSDYESDASGHYSVTAGVAVSQPQAGYDTVQVSGGDYLVFEKNPEIPQSAMNGWISVWQFFARENGYKRTFVADFETYQGAHGFAIFISVTKDTR